MAHCDGSCLNPTTLNPATLNPTTTTVTAGSKSRLRAAPGRVGARQRRGSNAHARLRGRGASGVFSLTLLLPGSCRQRGGAETQDPGQAGRGQNCRAARRKRRRQVRRGEPFGAEKYVSGRNANCHASCVTCVTVTQIRARDRQRGVVVGPANGGQTRTRVCAFRLRGGGRGVREGAQCGAHCTVCSLCVRCAEAHSASLVLLCRGGCSCASCAATGHRAMCWECKHGAFSVLHQGIHQMLHQGRDAGKARKTTVHRCRTECGHSACDWRHDSRESEAQKA